MSLSCRYIWICVGEFFEFLLIPCFYLVSFNWRQSYLFSGVCSIEVTCIQRVLLKFKMTKPIPILLIQEEKNGKSTHTKKILQKKRLEEEMERWGKKMNKKAFFLLRSIAFFSFITPCIPCTVHKKKKCVLLLTISGLKGDSNCLRSNFFQSISWKKAFSMTSPCGLLGEPNLVFAFLSNNFRNANDSNVNLIFINNKERNRLVWHLLCLIYLRLHRSGKMDTMEFHYILTKIKRLRRTHWTATVRLTFHIIVYQMTTNQCFDYNFDPEAKSETRPYSTTLNEFV